MNITTKILTQNINISNADSLKEFQQMFKAWLSTYTGKYKELYASLKELALHDDEEEEEDSLIQVDYSI